MHDAAPAEDRKGVGTQRAVLFKTVVAPARPDECCGFGGTFSVSEEVVSSKMGNDKVTDHARAGAEYVVSADSSCLMHQKGCAERIGVPIKFIHIAQILNGATV
jgi:L-lactate dehydrogenase complex protein LldE